MLTRRRWSIDRVRRGAAHSEAFSVAAAGAGCAGDGAGQCSPVLADVPALRSSALMTFECRRDVAGLHVRFGEHGL